MDKLLKRYFWVVHVVLIASTAGLLALAANNIFGGLLAPWAVNAPPPPNKPALGSNTGVPGMSRTAEDPWGKDPEPVKVEEEVEKVEEEVEEVVEQVEGEYPESDLQVTLTGTMVAGNPTWSMALLIDNSSRASFMAKQDESLLEEGSRLVKIERDRIVIERNGQLEQIELSETGQIARPKPGFRPKPTSRTLTGKPLSGPASTPKLSSTKPDKPALNSPHADLKAGIKKLNENQFEVSRKTLNEAISNPSKFRDGTRPIPNYKGGKVNGFKLVGMKPGSIYYELGIRPGDIITSVNGKPLDSPNRALELYQKLGSLSNVSIEVDRSGQKRNLSFNIK